jgi:hypothetical protein
LTELLHVVCATREGRRKNGSFAQVIEIGINICNNSICQTLIKLHPKIVLNGSQLTHTLLLSNCPRLTDICLKEPACKKEMVGLNMSGANVKAIVKVFFQGHMLSTIILILYWPVENIGMPTNLPSWKKKDIVQ